MRQSLHACPESLRETPPRTAGGGPLKKILVRPSTRLAMALAMRHNAAMAAREVRAEISSMTGAPSDEEAAAVVAALEQMLRDATPLGMEPEIRREPWLDAALVEGVSRGFVEHLPEPWINA